MKEKLIDWLTGSGGVLRVRGLLALAGMGTLCYMALNGDIGADVFVGVIAPILGFYAGIRSQRS